MAEGTITRKEIITDEALAWGGEYAKTLDLAIGKHKEFVQGVLALNDANNLLRASNNQKDYVENQKKVNTENQKTLGIWKEQIQLENALISTKKKNELATEGTSRALVKERLELALVNKQVKQEALERLGLVSAYTKLNQARTDAKNKLRDLIATEGTSIEQIKKAQKEYDTLNKKVIAADHAVDDFSKTVGNYPFQNAAKGLRNLITAFGVTGGIAAFGGILKGAYNEIKIFEQGVADLSAITGATGKDLEYLKNQAIELGKGTKGGATAVVEAYKLIASAKPELLENVQALNQVTEAVLTLSKASGMEMPAAAIALTDAMNQFGAPAEQAGIFIDALANGAKFGSAEIPQVTEALLKFGAVARSSNVDIQESTALIELLAENGLKGADAGTALRNVLLKISAPDALPKRAKEEFDRLGISLETLKDKSVPIQQRLELLKPLLKDNASIVKIFGLENATAAINVLSHTDRLKDLTSKMYENGTAAEQAAKRSDTLQGDTDKLISTYDSLILSLNKGSGVVTGFFRFFVDGARGALDGLIKLNSTVEELGNKSRSKGAEYSLKVFNIEKTKEELEANRNTIAQEMGKTTELINKLTKELNERSFLASFNPFAKGKAVAKKEITDLYNTLGQYEGAYKKIQSKLNPKKVTIPGVTDPGTETDNADAENAKEKAAREKAAKEALDRAKRLSDSLYELEKQRLEQTIRFNQEIANDDKETDELRIAALNNAQVKQIQLTDLTKKHLLDADKFVLAKDKLNANEKIRIKEDAENKIIDINKKTSDEIDKIRVFDEAKYQKELEDKVSKLNVEQNAELESENRKFQSLGDLEAMSQKDREKAIEDHERKIFDIKKQYSIKALKLQISNLETELAASDLLPINEQISADKRQKIAETLSKAKLDLSEVEISVNKNKNEVDVNLEREKAEKILDISGQLTGALTDLANAVFDTKIQNIEYEIDKNNEYYDKQIELAGNDERQKDLLSKEREKKNDELEKKKRKEQHKAAVFNKASAVAQAGISTALAILAALQTQPFLPLGPTMATLAGVLGAIQIGAILATPIPKYKMGRKGGPAETAWVGDGFVSEVITKGDGSNPRLTPNTPTLTNLDQGDIVHKSVEDYNRYIRASILSGFNQDHRKLSEFQMMQTTNSYGKETLEELKRNTNAILNKRFPSNDSQPMDINHHLWKMGNTNWK
ncbi:MAG: phage tail tape measure protein [Bacteroidota bacterium]